LGVFVDESAESVASVELVWPVRTDWAWPWYRWCQRERAVWPVGVVVADIDAQDALELPAAGDQEPVEAVAADGADPALGDRVRLRPRNGVRTISTLSLRKTLSKARPNLLSRSWMRNRTGVARSESDHASWRACWVVQHPSGFALQPATCTRRLLSSRKKST
jgi:hypothetical protein